jgi:hypothetical protein
MIMPLRIDNEGELREAQAALFNINSTAGWLLLNYVGPSTVHLAAGGDTGIEEMANLFDDDMIQYGLIRLVEPQAGDSLKSIVRDVFVTYVGSAVGIMEKNKKAAFLSDAQDLLQPFHAAITVLNRDGFNRETILERSHSSSGNNVID